MGRVTLRDIAKVLGCHHTTVSRALMGHPGIPVRTRERVREMAASMRYERDPAMDVLNAHRLSRRETGFHGVLAWLDFFPKPTPARMIHPQLWEGTCRRAVELGYRVEEFPAEWGEAAGRRLSQILRSRGIQGVLIPPLPELGREVFIEWNEFSCISLTPSLRSPPLHSAHNSQYETARALVLRLYELGYRRMGLMLDEPSDARVRYAWSSGFLGETHRLGVERAGAVLRSSSTARWEQKGFEKWFGKLRPDVIIGTDHDTRPHLQTMGLRVPEDVGCAWVAPLGFGPEASGMLQLHEQTGTAGIELLVGMIQRGERGIPESPVQVLTGARWHQGATVRSAQVSDNRGGAFH